MAQTPGQGTSSFELDPLLINLEWLVCSHRHDLTMMLRDQTASLSSLRGRVVYFKYTLTRHAV